MKIKIIPIFILIICCGTTWGQSAIYEFPALSADSAIVRHWKNGYNVIYASDHISGKYFLLTDTSAASTTAYKIDVPTDVTVNDFRILNDTIYLGGHQIDPTGNIKGVIACFSVFDFFAGIGSFHWGTMRSSVSTNCAGNRIFIQIHDIMRLALYDTNGRVHVAFIAKDTIDGIPPMRIGIGWALLDATNWKVRLIYNKDAKEAYTDIIATDNYVVAAARTNDSSRLALRVFPKSDYLVPTSSCEDFYINKYGDGWADHTVESDVMATAMEGNTFAVAYHYLDGTGPGLAIKTFGIGGGHANLVGCLEGFVIPPPGDPDWKLRDICYFNSTQRILVLDDVSLNATTGYTRHIFQFQHPFAASGTYNGRILLGWRFYSLDTFDPYGMHYASAGINSSAQLNLFCEDINTTNSCGQTDAFIGYTTSASRYQTYMETYINNPLSYYNTTTFVPIPIARETSCTNQ